MSKVYVYSLCDPRTEEVRYIGKAKDTANRLCYHLAPSNLIAKTHKTGWIKSLLRDNLEPTINVIEETNEISWQNRERYWILYYQNLGHRLTNGTPGGEGNHNPPQSVRQKISKTLTGRKLPDSVKKKIAGDRNPLAKLTNEQAKEIREAYYSKDNKSSLRKLGMKYGVSGNTILDIVHNRRYRDELVSDLKLN